MAILFNFQPDNLPFGLIFYMKNIEWWSRTFPRINALLLVLVIFPVFIIPSLPASWSGYLYPPFFTGIFITAAFSIHTKRKAVLYTALLLAALFLIAHIGDWYQMKIIIRCLQILFFFFMVTALIKEISQSEQVNKTVIIDAITGYLLLGFAFSLLITIVSSLHPGAYNVLQNTEVASKNLDAIREYIYYAFITFTTTGYGDILPVSPVAKSLAIFIGISGQLYIAIIISLLVGKFASVKK
jgi:voltage-gated potassium channel